MSGWIKMGTGLSSHPKVKTMRRALKADLLRVIGGLWAVWCVFDEHSAAGRLDGYTLKDMDEEIGWKGFSAAMRDIGWLIESEGGIEAPDYEQHNGPNAKRRALDASRKGQSRAGKADTETGSDPPEDRTPVRDVSASDADNMRNREDKRREEEKTSSLPKREQPELGPPLRGAEGEDELPEPDGKPTPYGAITQALRKAGIQRCNPGHLTFRALVDAGATAEEFIAYAEVALTKRDPFAYLLSVVESARVEAKEVAAAVHRGSLAPPDPAAWRKSDLATRAMASQLGVTYRDGESAEDWERRIFTTWQRAGKPALKPTETA